VFLGLLLPPYPSSTSNQWYTQSNEIALNMGMKCLKLSIQWTWFENNYSSDTCRSNEKISTNTRAPQEKGKSSEYQCCLVVPFQENLWSGSDILKFMWWFSRYGFEPDSFKIWTLLFEFYHIFSNSRISGPYFWTRSDPSTYYIFPNAKEYMNTNFYNKLK
jgi:hypothetical protein